MNIEIENNIDGEVNIEKTHEECMELKTIKYKTMLINGVTINESKSSQSLQKLDEFLEEEKTCNETEPWCKLNKTNKIKKILDYVEIYKKEKNLDEEESGLLIQFLRDCLDRKKLQRIKDVLYDKENGVILEIPALTYVKTTKHFTLKNIEKRVSTLKSLPPKKSNAHGTIKNKNAQSNSNSNKMDNNSSDEEN